MKLLQVTKNHRKTQDFGANANNGIYGPKGHDGVDYGPIVGGVEGDSLFAVDEADVIEAKDNGPYGNWIKIRLINFPGVELAYGHCKSFISRVGDRVHMGDEIAKLGNTHSVINGHPTSTAPHVHVIMWIDGVKVSVDQYLTLSYNEFMNEVEKLRKDHEDAYKETGEKFGATNARMDGHDERLDKQSDRINSSVKDAKDSNKVLRARVEKDLGHDLPKLTDEEREAAVGKQ